MSGHIVGYISVAHPVRDFVTLGKQPHRSWTAWRALVRGFEQVRTARPDAWLLYSQFGEDALPHCWTHLCPHTASCDKCQFAPSSRLKLVRFASSHPIDTLHQLSRSRHLLSTPRSVAGSQCSAFSIRHLGFATPYQQLHAGLTPELAHEISRVFEAQMRHLRPPRFRSPADRPARARLPSYAISAPV